MSRLVRVAAAGVAHHVQQEGNNGQPVFLEDSDFEQYLAILRDQSRKGGLGILGYCLTETHVRLVVTPEKEASLSSVLGRIDFRYAQWFNGRYGRHGHLWQQRFRSCPIQGSYVRFVLRDVDLEPVRSGLAERPIAYEWSSARAHLTGLDDWDLLDLEQWSRVCPLDDWDEALAAELEGEAPLLKKLIAETRRGAPFGDEEFIGELETVLGRRLKPNPVGRPRKRRDPLYPLAFPTA